MSTSEVMCRAIKLVYGKLPFVGPAADVGGAKLSSPAKSETEDLEGSPKEILPPQEPFSQLHVPEYLPVGQGDHISRQRSVFDTPPPSPPPT